jgi:hypothetical protein
MPARPRRPATTQPLGYFPGKRLSFFRPVQRSEPRGRPPDASLLDHRARHHRQHPYARPARAITSIVQGASLLGDRARPPDSPVRSPMVAPLRPFPRPFSGRSPPSCRHGPSRGNRPTAESPSAGARSLSAASSAPARQDSLENNPVVEAPLPVPRRFSGPSLTARRHGASRETSPWPAHGPRSSGLHADLQFRILPPPPRPVFTARVGRLAPLSRARGRGWGRGSGR